MESYNNKSENFHIKMYTLNVATNDNGSQKIVTDANWNWKWTIQFTTRILS